MGEVIIIITTEAGFWNGIHHVRPQPFWFILGGVASQLKPHETHQIPLGFHKI